MSNNIIGENIRKYRMMAGYTQAELAVELGKVENKNVAPSAIAGYENGQRVPKVEVRIQIANILGVDPVALSGIEMSETDEKRMLCKLLMKYASNISLKKDGTVNLDLPDDFAGFQMEYAENRERLSSLLTEMSEGSIKEITMKSSDDELNYWVEMYPAYDPVTVCKEKKGKYSIEDIKKYRNLINSECKMEFFNFEDSYLVPLRNKEIMERIRNNDLHGK